MEDSKSEDDKILAQALLTKLGGKEYMRLKFLIKEAEENLKKRKTLLLLLQIPLLSAQEEIGLVLQLFRNII